MFLDGDKLDAKCPGAHSVPESCLSGVRDFRVSSGAGALEVTGPLEAGLGDRSPRQN